MAARRVDGIGPPCRLVTWLGRFNKNWQELMAQTGAKAEKHGALATRHDVVDILGHLDDGKMVAIMALKPTVAEMEEASV